MDQSEKPNYDVYIISFKGKRTFTSHLFDALTRKGFSCFKAEGDGLEKGKYVFPLYLEELGRSRIAIVVFYPSYAASNHCYQIVKKIDGWRKQNRLVALPVFYDTKPNEVRKNLVTSFRDAFDHHEKLFEMNKGMQWSPPLTEIASFFGWELENNSTESALINHIVERVSHIFTKLKSPLHSDLVGIKSRLEKLQSYWPTELYGVRTIGICGMAGIGKTTLAERAFHSLRHQFVTSAFVPEVSGIHSKRGLIHLQNTLCRMLLQNDISNKNINVGMGSTELAKRLRNFKVLVVLDDVDQVDQIHALVGKSGKQWLASGSRVIITTRNAQLLFDYGADLHYMVPKLNEEESRELFSQLVLSETEHIDDYKGLREIVGFARGVPAVIKLIGPYLPELSRQLNNGKKLLTEAKYGGDIDRSISPKLFDLSQDLLMNMEKKTLLSILSHTRWLHRHKLASKQNPYLPLEEAKRDRLQLSGVSQITFMNSLKKIPQSPIVSKPPSSAGFSPTEEKSSMYRDADLSFSTSPVMSVPINLYPFSIPIYAQELIMDRKLFQVFFKVTRIPDWFRNQSSTWPVPIPFPENGDYRSITGIVVCAVFQLKRFSNFDKVWKKKTSCHFHVGGNHIGKVITVQLYENHLKPFGICFYVPREWFGEHLSNVNIGIKASIMTERPDVEVMSCGVNLVFEQDVEDFGQNLYKTAKKTSQFVWLDLIQHFEDLLNVGMKLEDCGADPNNTVTSSHEGLEEAHKNRITTISPMKSDLQSSLSTLLQGRRYAENNSFYFVIHLGFFSPWFFHHCLGDTTICYIPPDIHNDENWVGLELYVLFKKRPTVRQSNKDSNQTPSLLLADIYAHGTNTIPILTYPLLINDPFFGPHSVLYHVPRVCFPEEFRQCQGISTFFRPSDRDLEVEMCGTRLLYEQDYESLIQVVIDSAQDRDDALTSLQEQALMYLNAETDKRDEVEQYVPNFGLFSSFERRRIQSLQKLLTNTDREAEVIRSHKKADKEFESIVLHCKQDFPVNQEHDHVTSGNCISRNPTSSFNHLCIMFESLAAKHNDLVYWIEDLEVLLKELFKGCIFVTISVKGNIISLLEHFDPFSTYNVCLAHQKIPKWFNHNNLSSEAWIMLPSKIGNSSLKGLAVCAAAFSAHDDIQALHSDTPIKIMCHLEMAGCCLNPVSVFSITKEKLKWFGNGFTWVAYIPSFLLSLSESSADGDLRITFYSDFMGLKVVHCGARYLYEEDIKEFEESIVQCWTSFLKDFFHQFVEDEDYDEKLSEATHDEDGEERMMSTINPGIRTDGSVRMPSGRNPQVAGRKKSARRGFWIRRGTKIKIKLGLN